MFYLFWDMCSGGDLKIPPLHYIFVEADSEKDAKERFMTKFERDPDNITCPCCGEDFSWVSNYSDTLEKETAYHRKDAEMSDFLKREDVYFLPNFELSEREQTALAIKQLQDRVSELEKRFSKRGADEWGRW